MSTIPQLPPPPGAVTPPPAAPAAPAPVMTPEVREKRNEVRGMLDTAAANYKAGGKVDGAQARKTLREWLETIPELYRLNAAEVDQAVATAYTNGKPAKPKATAASLAAMGQSLPPTEQPDPATNPNPGDGVPEGVVYVAPPKATGKKAPMVPAGKGMDVWAGETVNKHKGKDNVSQLLQAARISVTKMGGALAHVYHSALEGSTKVNDMKADVRLLLAILDGTVPSMDQATFDAAVAARDGAPAPAPEVAEPVELPATAPEVADGLEGLDDGPTEEVLPARPAPPSPSANDSSHAAKRPVPATVNNAGLDLVRAAYKETRSIVDGNGVCSAGDVTTATVFGACLVALGGAA